MIATLSISAAAERLGVSIDALRKYENDGRIIATRSPGGQRRFSEKEVERFKAEISDSNAERLEDETDLDDEDIEEGRSPGRREARAPVVPEWESKVKNAAADVEVARARREQRQIEREEQLEAERLEREALAAQRRDAELARLAQLRAFGRAYATEQLVPTTLRGKIVADLETWVTSHQLPAQLPQADAEELIQDRVERLLRPWRTKLREKKEAQDAQRAIESLVQSGMSHGRLGTLCWDPDDRDEALKEVAAELDDEVDETWSASDVCELVDDVLAEWIEEEDDD